MFAEQGGGVVGLLTYELLGTAAEVITLNAIRDELELTL
jgi:hypothetical protein